MAPVLAAPMRVFRVGDANGVFPVWSAQGARRSSGRWHEYGAEVIYASENYSTALLEVLARWHLTTPRNQHFVEAAIPAGTSYEVVTPDVLPECFHPDEDAARRLGSAWYQERRSVVLVVPSVVARMERNVVINTRHPEYEGLRIEVGLETPVWWDRRLLS